MTDYAPGEGSAGGDGPSALDLVAAAAALVVLHGFAGLTAVMSGLVAENWIANGLLGLWLVGGVWALYMLTTSTPWRALAAPALVIGAYLAIAVVGSILGFSPG